MRVHPQSSLLPPGFADYLPEEAEKLRIYENILCEQFRNHGYLRVTPPLMEYETSLLPHIYKQDMGAKSASCFRLMDPVTQHMMAIRADITGQIARIADTRLNGENIPQRLYYSGSVLRIEGNQLQHLRQLTQIGCEYFGNADHKADAEIIMLALDGIYKLGIDQAGLDLTLPAFVPNLLQSQLDAADLTADQRQNLHDGLRGALAQKDRAKIREKLADHHPQLMDLLLSLLDINGPAADGLARLRKIIPHLNAFQADLVAPLFDIYDHLQKMMTAQSIEKTIFTLDLTDFSGFDYHEGVSFQIFAQGLRSELGRGGRYLTHRQGQAATGFSLYLETILPLLPDLALKKSLLVPPECTQTHINQWIDKDYRVLRAVKSDGALAAQAIDAGCTHYADQQGNIQPVT